jgi:hypothetical protein
MMIPARKLAAALAVAASGLLSLAPVASADDLNPQFEAVGLAGATPLADRSMDGSRGGGFATGLSGWLLSLLPGVDGSSTTAAASAGARGSPGSFLPALLEGLPAINLVAAQLNDQPTVMRIGTAAQSLGCGNGLSCPVGMNVSLYANNNAPAGSLSLNLDITH